MMFILLILILPLFEAHARHYASVHGLSVGHPRSKPQLAPLLRSQVVTESSQKLPTPSANQKSSGLISRKHSSVKREETGNYSEQEPKTKDEKFLEQEAKRVISMLIVTGRRLSRLFDYLNETDVPRLTFMPSKTASTFRTWSSIIHPDLPTQGSPDKADRRKTLNQLAEVRALTIYMADKLVNPNQIQSPHNHGLETPYVQILANDTWLKDRGPNGGNPPGPDMFWDSRTGFVRAQNDRRWVTMEGGKFEDGDHRLFAMWQNIVGPVSTVVACNQYYFDYWRYLEKDLPSFDVILRKHGTATPKVDPDDDIPRNMSGNRMSPKLRPLNNEGSLELSSLIYGHLAPTLLNALTQLKVTMPNGQTLAGPDYDIGLPHEDMTAWKTVTETAQKDPEYSHRISKNFVYLVVALYMDTFDWSTGFNRRIGRARLN